MCDSLANKNMLSKPAFLQATSHLSKANPLTFLGLHSSFESLEMRGLYSITQIQRIDVKNSAYIYNCDTTLQIFVEEAEVQLHYVFWYVGKRQINKVRKAI